MTVVIRLQPFRVHITPKKAEEDPSSAFYILPSQRRWASFIK